MGGGEGVGQGTGEGSGERRRGGRRAGRRRAGLRRRRRRGRGGRIPLFCCCFPSVGPKIQAVNLQMNAEQVAQYNAYIATMTPEQKAAYDMQLLVHYGALNPQAQMLQTHYGIQSNQQVANPQLNQTQANMSMFPTAPSTVTVSGTAPGAVPSNAQYMQPNATAPQSTGQQAGGTSDGQHEDMDDDDVYTIEPMVVENPPIPGMLPPPGVAQPVPVN